MHILLNVQKRKCGEKKTDIVGITNTSARFPNHCCHRRATMPSLFIVDIHASLSTALETAEEFPWMHSKAFCVLLCYLFRCQLY